MTIRYVPTSPVTRPAAVNQAPAPRIEAGEVSCHHMATTSAAPAPMITPTSPSRVGWSR